MACLVPIGTIYISSVRQQLGLLLVARPFGLAIIDADAVRPLAIEDVAGYFESIRHFALGELELCGEGLAQSQRPCDHMHAALLLYMLPACCPAVARAVAWVCQACVTSAVHSIACWQLHTMSMQMTITTCRGTMI